MTSLVATREALERFTEELPAAGLKPGRLRRHAIGTQAMITQALSTERPATIWIDHNLATLVSEALEEPALQRPALTFFRGIRRRLKQALANDPDGLAPALALALGGARSSDDPQTEEEAALVLKALANPHAGPRLLNAAVHLLARAARKKGGAAAKLFQSARGDFETLVTALKKRLPNHRDKVGETLANPRSRLNHQVPPPGGRVRDGFRHFALLRPVLVRKRLASASLREASIRRKKRS